jgi:hypothetical protein
MTRLYRIASPSQRFFGAERLYEPSRSPAPADRAL